MTERKKPGLIKGRKGRFYEGQRRINVLLNQEESNWLEAYCDRHMVSYAEAVRRGLKKLEEKTP